MAPTVAGGTNLVAGGYVKIVGTQLQVDVSGGANSWVTIANVSGSGAVAIRYLSGGAAANVSVARSAGQEMVLDKHASPTPSHAPVLDDWHDLGDSALHGPYDPVAAHFHVAGII